MTKVFQEIKNKNLSLIERIKKEKGTPQFKKEIRNFVNEIYNCSGEVGDVDERDSLRSYILFWTSNPKYFGVEPHPRTLMEYKGH